MGNNTNNVSNLPTMGEDITGEISAGSDMEYEYENTKRNTSENIWDRLSLSVPSEGMLLDTISKKGASESSFGNDREQLIKFLDDFVGLGFEIEHGLYNSPYKTTKENALDVIRNRKLLTVYSRGTGSVLINTYQDNDLW